MSNLAEHYLVSHTREQPYRCTQCDRTFNTVCKRRLHVIKVHGGPQRNTTEKNLRKRGSTKPPSETKKRPRMVSGGSIKVA